MDRPESKVNSNYIFKRKAFWITWTTIFTAFIVLFTYIPIEHEIVSDLSTTIMEPFWHVLLRWAGLIDGGEYARYEASIQPIVHQLPYIVLGYAVLSMALIAVIFFGTRLSKRSCI